MDILVTYLGTFFGLAGLIFALWQNRQKSQLEQLLKATNWFNYQRSNNSNGTLQLALKAYKEKHADSLDPEVVEHLARADAFGQEVHKESVRQVHFSEPSFTKQDIEAWKADGKISDSAIPLFLQLVDSRTNKDV